MKFLYLYRYCPDYHFDKYLHTDVVPFFEKAGHKCMAYGHRLHEAYDKSIVLQPYDYKTTLAELHEKFVFDIILIGTQSRMFMNYRPPLVNPIGKEIRLDCILPPDFKEWKGPKVLLEEDFHYEDNTNWLNDVHIDIVLQRHFSNVERFKNVDKYNIKCFWFPFSVDINLFKPNNLKRLNKISMTGSVTNHVYPCRKMIIDKLSREGLLAEFKGRIIYNDYIKNLQSHLSHASCSSIFSVNPAKMWEIMASGSLLFTDDNSSSGIYELFDKDTFLCYNKDGSDLIQKATWVVNNLDEVKNMTLKARNQIEEKHSHEVRIKELIDILKREL